MNLILLIVVKEVHDTFVCKVFASDIKHVGMVRYRQSMPGDKRSLF